MNVDYVTIGEITIDDIVLETGDVMLDQPGGGCIFSALGIWIWGHSIGINSVVGFDYPQDYLDKLCDYEISIEGISRIDEWSLRLWLLHEENNKKQQFPKLQSSSFDLLDKSRQEPPASYFDAKGFHIATGTPEGQMRSRDLLRQKSANAIISLDILAENFVNLDLYRNGEALKNIDIFSPSVVEIEALWPGKSIDEVIEIVSDFGIRWFALKMDSRGSIVVDAHKNLKHHIPVYPANPIDTTGAGDAYSGGFLEGIIETGDVLEAGYRGTISASFAIEQFGALGMLSYSTNEALIRLESLRKSTGQYEINLHH